MSTRINYEFSNLCGGTYRRGNVLFEGNTLLSPVGNRVTCYDLENNRNSTFAFHTRYDISLMDLTSDRSLMVLTDVENTLYFVNFRAQINLDMVCLGHPVGAIKISHCKRYCAVGCGNTLRIFTMPSADVMRYKEGRLLKMFSMFNGDVTSLSWTRDSRFIVAGSEDNAVRVIPLNMRRGTKQRPYATLSSHRFPVLLTDFVGTDGTTIISVSKDRTVCIWSLQKDKPRIAKEEPVKHVLGGEEFENTLVSAAGETALVKERLGEVLWYCTKKTILPRQSKITSARFHTESSILVCGFKDGTFDMYKVEGAEVTPLHSLSVSAQSISTVDLSSNGELIAVGSGKLGQLLVWEWRSETYRLKQQAHQSNDITCTAYSTDGAYVATGGSDGALKIWKGSHGYCFVTFREHGSAVVAVQFNNRNAVFSCSTDGTIKGFDVERYKHFRTWTTPEPVRFSCMSLDPSFETIAAGCSDRPDVFLWSVRKGVMLEVLQGHTGPISSLSFCPKHNVLATASWDKTIRVWSLYDTSGEGPRGKGGVEPMEFYSEVLQVQYSPSGNSMLASTLNGMIRFVDTSDPSAELAEIHGGIDVTKDIKGGYTADSPAGDYNKNTSRYVNTLAISPDGKYVLCGGNTKWICLYDIEGRFLLRKWPVSDNFSVEGVTDYNHWRKFTAAGHLDTIEDQDTDEEDRDRNILKLPGVKKGEHGGGKRSTRPTAHCKQVAFSPLGGEWNAATPDGLAVFALDAHDRQSFHPLRLVYDLTPGAVKRSIVARKFVYAIEQALALNDQAAKNFVFHSVPASDLQFICNNIPLNLVKPLFHLLAGHAERHVHVEFVFHWTLCLLKRHFDAVISNKNEYRDVLKSLLHALVVHTNDIQRLANENTHAMAFIACMAKLNHEPPQLAAHEPSPAPAAADTRHSQPAPVESMEEDAVQAPATTPTAPAKKKRKRTISSPSAVVEEENTQSPAAATPSAKKRKLIIGSR